MIQGFLNTAQPFLILIPRLSNTVFVSKNKHSILQEREHNGL